MTIIQKEAETDNAILKCCQGFMKRFEIKQLLRQANATKEKGVPVYEIFTFLLGLVFSGKNLYALMVSCQEKVPCGKDAVYRFLNKSTTNWNRFVIELARLVIPQVDRLTKEERASVLIIDDSAYYRNRSKNVEMLSRCWDHVKKQYYKGLTLLVVGWSDGQTFLPVDFRLVASSNDENLLEDAVVKTDNRTLATKRRIDARKEKPALVLEMLQAIKGTAAQAKYVLFDSWFTSPSSLLAIRKLGYHVVARLKNHEKHLYVYQGERLAINSIYRKCKKRRGKARYLLCVEVLVQHKNFPSSIPAQIVYVRDRTDRKKWIALISTDMSMSAEEIIALYGKRWDIETFFKFIKSYLQLAKEFQTRSYDAMVAHTAIVLTRYTLLSLENRENKDDRTIGVLFYLACKELEDISFAHAFELLLETLRQSLSDYAHLSKLHIDSFISQFMDRLPTFLKAKLRLSLCES